MLMKVMSNLPQNLIIKLGQCLVEKKKHMRQCLANVQLFLSYTEPQLCCRDTVKPRYN